MDVGPGRRVQMLRAVAPIRKGQVVVDADEVHIRIGPERVEVEMDVLRSVLRLVAEVFRPVGGVADLRNRTEDRAHIRCERPEGRDGRIGARCAAGLRDPAQLAADQEGIDPARRGAEMGIVQNHPPEAPVRPGAGERDGRARDRELGPQR